MFGLEIKPSKIIGAGNGLFATRDLSAKQSYLCPFGGELLDSMELEERYPHDKLGKYTVVSQNGKFAHDASKVRGIGAMANSIINVDNSAAQNAEIERGLT